MATIGTLTLRALQPNARWAPRIVRNEKGEVVDVAPTIGPKMNRKARRAKQAAGRAKGKSDGKADS